MLLLCGWDHLLPHYTAKRHTQHTHTRTMISLHLHFPLVGVRHGQLRASIHCHGQSRASIHCHDQSTASVHRHRWSIKSLRPPWPRSRWLGFSLRVLWPGGRIHPSWIGSNGDGSSNWDERGTSALSGKPSCRATCVISTDVATMTLSTQSRTGLPVGARLRSYSLFLLHS